MSVMVHHTSQSQFKLFNKSTHARTLTRQTQAVSLRIY